MRGIHKILIASALYLITIISYAAATTTPTTTPTTTGGDISGNYKCSGYDPYDKTNYNENLVFTKNGDTYNVQLIHSDSVVPYNLGTGLASNDGSNTVGMVYWDPQKPATNGTELFEIKSDGSINGVWTSSGTKDVGTRLH